jgi:ER membrane protein complex subunit 1
MHLPLQLPWIAAALFARAAIAVFADEAGTIDYHFPLLGEPRESTSFFHQPNPASRASLVYTLSERGVLGAVNPRDGAIVWRHLLAANATRPETSFLRAGHGADVVVSGFGNQVAAWSAADGRQAWSLDVPGQLEDVETLELSDGTETAGAKDAVALTGGDLPTLYRIDGTSGAVKWTYKIEGGDVPYQVSASSTEVFAILLHKTMLGYIKLKVLSFNPVTGQKKDEYVLSSDSELATADTIISVGANSASPIVAWTDAARSVLKVNVLGTKGIASFNIEKHGEAVVESVTLHAPYHDNCLSHFLVHYETLSSHWAEVFHIDAKNGKVEKAYSLPKLGGKGAFSTSTSDANVYFTRVTQDEVSIVSSASHGVLGRWPLTGYGVAAGAGETVAPVHAVSEVSVKGEAVSAVRTAVYLNTGDWVLLRDGSPVWNRPEVLANTVSATFAAPLEAEAFVHELEAEAHSNPVEAYTHRVKRHIQDLQRLPAIFQALPQRIVNGFLGTSADDVASDAFGFHQVIACATENGRLVALDPGKPDRIIWSQQVADLQPSQSWQPSISSPKGGILEVSSKAGTGVQYNSTTGELLYSILPIDVDAPAQKAVKYTLHDSSLEATIDASPAWHFTPPAGEHLVSLVPRPVNDPVASIGKVLGDRRVLYKYLDPNLALLVTANDAAGTATVYLLNTVSGAVIFSSVHTGVDLSAPIASIVSENWFAYSFTGEPSDDAPKGHQLVVGELLESLAPNDRGPLGTTSNYSSLESNAQPFTLTQTYQIPERISKLSVTQTRQGITSRQLLAVLPDSSAIVGIPYAALDPRRPVNRDPTKDEQMEGLTKYAPVIEFDPKWYLNHRLEVLGIKDVVTSPALIESTSLVFAYGLDVFGTRLSPSFSFDILGKDFNKLQMLATVAALAVATFVVAPLVSPTPICVMCR